MAIAIVQTAAVAGFANTATFGAGVTLGNYLVITGGAYSSTTPPANTASPTIGGIIPVGATKLIQEPSAGTTDTVFAATWLLPVTAAIAGGEAVSFPFTGDTGPVGVVAYEFSGLGSAAVLDRSSSSNGTTAAVTSLTTPAIRSNPELVIGFMIGYAQGQADPAGYTNIDGSGGSNYFLSGYQIVTSGSGTYVYNATASTAANWAAGIVTIALSLPVTTTVFQSQGQPVRTRIPSVYTLGNPGLVYQ